MKPADLLAALTSTVTSTAPSHQLGEQLMIMCSHLRLLIMIIRSLEENAVDFRETMLVFVSP